MDENKVELFEFLTNEVMKRSHAKWVYATDKESVLCSHQDADTDFISPCNHEEADTRVIIHAFDAARKGSQKLLIRTVDTDILVLAIAYVERLGVQELWVAFGTGKKFRYLAAYEISQALGSAKIKSASDVSFIHRMRHGVSLCRKRQKNCMGGLESVSEDNRVIQ